MKRLLSTLCGLAFAAIASAAPGDTTVVVSHNGTHLSWYQGYDTTVTFPDGTVSYNKIVMEFNIGKYACPGYDPNNPGEGGNRTGWCADWDYDVHALAMTASGDTFELGRLITPYANNNNPSTPANWNQSYYFDVTDYYSILKDDVTIRIFYAGWSGGFTGTIKFHMVEGPRVKNVLAIKSLWRDGYAYGKSYDPIDALIEADSIEVPAGTASAAMKMIITGHGNATQGCAEFCRKYYHVEENGVSQGVTFIWRDN